MVRNNTSPSYKMHFQGISYTRNHVISPQKIFTAIHHTLPPPMPMSYLTLFGPACSDAFESSYHHRFVLGFQNLLGTPYTKSMPNQQESHQLRIRIVLYRQTDRYAIMQTHRSTSSTYLDPLKKNKKGAEIKCLFDKKNVVSLVLFCVMAMWTLTMSIRWLTDSFVSLEHTLDYIAYKRYHMRTGCTVVSKEPPPAVRLPLKMPSAINQCL